MKKENLKRLALTAVMIALAAVLSEFPIVPLPLAFGGKATLASMLPIILIVLKYDFKWGFFTAFTYSVVQMGLSLAKVLSWGLSPIILVGCIMLDYILPYTVLCFAGVFKKKGNVGVMLSATLAMVLRFVMHLFSGLLLWDYITEMGFWGALWYSVTYNGSFMLPEIVITLGVLAALIATKAYKRIMKA